VVSSSWTREGRALVEVGSETIISLEFVIEEMGIFGSTDEVWMSVFLGEDLVLLCWF
jgi:hypothetical protein